MKNNLSSEPTIGSSNSEQERKTLLVEASLRLLAAQSFFNEAIESEAIDQAIYELLEAEELYRKILELNYQRGKGERE